MVTLQILRAMSVPVLGVVLFVTPAWAELEHRAGVPPLHGPQPGGVHERQPHGTGSITTHRGGLSRDSHTGRGLNSKSVGGRVGGSRTTTSSHGAAINVSPGEIPTHDARDAGMPVWRW